MNTIYDDDTKVGGLTREAFARTGSRLLQIHRFTEPDESHVSRLLDIFDPPPDITIADVGCGVGRLAQLMRKYRPDLTFYLINKSKEQLAMCPWDKRLKIEYGIAEALPINKADAVMVTYVLGHIDLDKFIRECVRVGAKHVYIYDLFKRDPFCDCRLTSDLQYEEREIEETVLRFAEVGGFTLTKRDITTFVPDSIAALMPSHETLNNTVSAALVFER